MLQCDIGLPESRSAHLGIIIPEKTFKPSDQLCIQDSYAYKSPENAFSTYRGLLWPVIFKTANEPVPFSHEAGYRRCRDFVVVQGNVPFDLLTLFAGPERRRISRQQYTGNYYLFNRG